MQIKVFLFFFLNFSECTIAEKSPSIKVHRVTDPPFFSSKFNFNQTVSEMVFVSFEVEKMRMFLVQSVAWYCVLVRRRGVQ